ncbi:MAG: hypothetical protein KME43_17530 [Myxacorys chilensis ATA2-1-KO14]|jgi:hypothetical protein|nr:hypothetical protein [Myxacorys chilensis ATA2-1-KO14]
MKAVKATGSINEQGQLSLDHPLTVSKNSRVEVIVLIPEEPESNDEQTKEAILEDFRQAWHEAMTGQTIPVSQIWDGVEDD